MPDKFQNKYRNGTFRAQWWDYGWNGAYFITICTQNREHFFGEIENGKMNLSNTGVIATILWNEIPNHHDFVELGDFVVMPNHVHGILIINKSSNNKRSNLVDKMGGDIVGGIGDNIVGGIGDNIVGDIVVEIVGPGHALDLQFQQYQKFQQPTDNPTTPGAQRFQNIGKNTISSIIGSYKSAVTKYANRLGFPNGWQRLFHEHIIRNDAEYQRISDYIVNNPVNWGMDKFRQTN